MMDPTLSAAIAAHAALVREELAQRVRDDLPGVAVEVEAERLVLRGRGVRARWADFIGRTR